MSELTQDLLKELFEYRDGELYRKISTANRVKKGDLAGTLRVDGYRYTRVRNKLYLAHRLIFLYHNGFLPEFLDHIDVNPLNNNINNLREATHSQNHMNKRKDKSYNGNPTSSRFKGVTWDKGREKWMAQITINGINKNIGRFTSESDAAKAYDAAAIEMFGEFAKLNSGGRT